MQKGKISYKNIVKEIDTFFSEQIKIGQKYGIQQDKFILDPGIGFGKTVVQNIEIIKKISEFAHFKLPLAVGISRKSHLGSILKEELALETNPSERIETSLAETAIAVQNGADIIRTHDIIQTKKFLTVLEKFL